MILEKQTKTFPEFDSQSFVTNKQLIEILENYKNFQKELIELFKIDQNTVQVLKIGNAKFLLSSIKDLDSQGKKIDVISKVRDIQLQKLLEEEKALFEIFSITDEFILDHNKSDLLIAETRYSAKQELLDHYNLSKFANYCRDHAFEDIVYTIKDYLKVKNHDNTDTHKLRLLYKNSDKKFYLRAKTSSEDYKDFGINFSVFVAIFSLGQYVEKTQNEIFIENYIIDDSNIYVWFALTNNLSIKKNLSLSFNLILENDEVKRNAVSFNGVFKLKYEDDKNSTEIYLKPKSYYRKDSNNHQVDLLTYPHRGSVKKVFEKIEELPTLIDYFIKQVSEDTKKISTINHPDTVREFIISKVKFSKKPEFKLYKDSIQKKLSSITVDNIFKLFELLNEVEALFGNDDVISKNFWRTKLYEALIQKE